MKAIPFTLSGTQEKLINIVQYSGPFFYPYLHRHKEFQLMWIIDGKGTLIADHKTYTFDKGDIFFIGANQAHIFRNDPQYFAKDSQKSIRGLAVFFELDGPMAPLFKLRDLAPIHSFLKESRGGFKIPVDKNFKLGRILAYLKNSEGARKLALFFNLIHELYSLKDRVIPLSPVGEEQTDEKALRIQSVCDFIFENYHQDIKLDEVAEQAYFTPPAFCRYFKKHTGKTFVRFLNELRVSEACKILINTKDEIQISEIAYKCGFNSVTNFNRVFKSVMGSTPSNYRKKYLNQVLPVE